MVRLKESAVERSMENSRGNHLLPLVYYEAILSASVCENGNCLLIEPPGLNGP